MSLLCEIAKGSEVDFNKELLIGIQFVFEVQWNGEVVSVKGKVVSAREDDEHNLRYTILLHDADNSLKALEIVRVDTRWNLLLLHYPGFTQLLPGRILFM